MNGAVRERGARAQCAVREHGARARCASAVCERVTRTAASPYVVPHPAPSAQLAAKPLRRPPPPRLPLPPPPAPPPYPTASRARAALTRRGLLGVEGREDLAHLRAALHLEEDLRAVGLADLQRDRLLARLDVAGLGHLKLKRERKVEKFPGGNAGTLAIKRGRRKVPLYCLATGAASEFGSLGTYLLPSSGSGASS